MNNEIEVTNYKYREISISNLNYSVSVKSTYENETIEFLTNVALSVLDNVKENKD